MFKVIGQIAILRDAEGGGTGGAGTGGEGGAGGATEHPISAPWGSDGVWKLGDGDKATPWWGVIPEGPARQHIEAKQYANPAELALANYNLTRLQTGDPNVVSLPGKDATPEQWNDFYTKIGRPETPDGYELKFGDGVKTDDNMVKFGKELFHELGVPASKAQAAADKWNAFVAEQEGQMIAAAQQQNTAELDALSSKWGADLEKNKAAGQRAVQALGLSNETIQRIEDSIGSAPVVELLAMIGRKSDEGGFTSGGSQFDPNSPATMNREQATVRIAELQGDAEFQKKYTDKMHPEHANAVKLMEALFARS